MRDAEEDVEKNLYRGKKTSDNVGGKPTCGFSLHHDTFSALNYAQDFGTTVNESLKELRVRRGIHSRNKSPISRVKYFHAFVSTFNYVSPIGANSD